MYQGDRAGMYSWAGELGVRVEVLAEALKTLKLCEAEAEESLGYRPWFRPYQRQGLMISGLG